MSSDSPGASAPSTSSDERPLAGIVVLDLSRVLAGPFCCQLLADLGADVVKLERPGAGDETRGWGPPFDEQSGHSAYFLSCNRGKRSVAVDASSNEGRQVLDDLLRRADVMVENFLPDAVARFGLTPERLQQLNPRLVSCSISGFGRTGPWADAPGYDLVIQALSGLMSITGEPDGRPMKVGVALTDVLCGLFAAVSVLSGLLARERAAPNSAGGSRAFEVSLFECTLASLVNVAQSALTTGRTPTRWGNAHPNIAPYESFAASDGHLVAAVGNDRQFARLCQALDHPEWSLDPRFLTNPLRVEHRAELIPLLSAVFLAQPLPYWLDRLSSFEVPHARVSTVDAALHHPQSQARSTVVELSGGRYVAGPVRQTHHDGRPSPLTGPSLPPPRLGEHTVEILRDLLGYSPDHIDALIASGAVSL